MSTKRSERRKPQAAKNLDFMHKGTYLTKVRGPSATYRRFFKVDDDFLSFGYRGSKKVKWARSLCGNNEDMSKVYLSDVQDIRPGPISDVFVQSFDDLKVNRDRCFSVVVGAKHRTLDLVASNKETRDSWVNGLRHLKKKMSEANLATQQEIWMRELFKYADKNNDNALSLKEIVSLLKHLNIEVDHDQAKQIFETDLKEFKIQVGKYRRSYVDGSADDPNGDVARKHASDEANGIAGAEGFDDPTEGSEPDEWAQADTNKATVSRKGEDVLDVDEFIYFYQLLTQCEELEELFERYNYEGKYLDAMELKDFLESEQSTEMSIELCQKIINDYEPCPTVKEQNMLALDGFNAFMNSPLMEIFNCDHRVVYHDMELPMSDYWIDSSHNTYLTADQLVGPSAVEAYIRALKRGCRCVELDVWTGNSGDPVVYHGHTMTSKIKFKDILQAVSLYAFEASDYPVILSIENHCSVEQQKTMAHYFKTILGDALYTAPYPDDMRRLPCPESLRNKILIKAKKLPRRKEDTAMSDTGEVSDEDEAVAFLNGRPLDYFQDFDDIPFVDDQYETESNEWEEASDEDPQVGKLPVGVVPEVILTPADGSLTSNSEEDLQCQDSLPEDEHGDQVPLIGGRLNARSLKITDSAEEAPQEFLLSTGCHKCGKPHHRSWQDSLNEDNDSEDDNDYDDGDDNGTDDDTDGANLQSSQDMPLIHENNNDITDHKAANGHTSPKSSPCSHYSPTGQRMPHCMCYIENTDEVDFTLEPLKKKIVRGVKKVFKKKKRKPKAKKIPGTAVDEGEVSDEDEAAEMENVQEEVKQKKAHKHKLARELSDLVTICQSVSFKGFDYARKNYNCKQMSSFAEGKAEDLTKDEPQEYVHHNQFQLSRIYPGGLRTDSSNYDPVPMWNCGCQIVALNYQTPDEPMMLNKGLFRDNGGSGYVLKPAFLRDPSTTFSPEGPFPPEWKRTLTLVIISGYQLPKKKGDKAKNILDPYVKVSIHGVEADKQTVQTEHIQNNGFHPVWNATFDLEVQVPDLALIWFQVKDHQTLARNEMVAQDCLPFNSLKEGYRTVHLKTKQGEPIFGAALFIHVTIK